MTQRAMFRVLMKILGVYFLVVGAYDLLRDASQIFSQWALYTRQGFGPGLVSSTSILRVIVSGIELGAGLYLFVGGRFVVDCAFPLAENRCHECGYDLSGHASSICPECATKVTPTPDTPGDIS